MAEIQSAGLIRTDTPTPFEIPALGVSYVKDPSVVGVMA